VRQSTRAWEGGSILDSGATDCTDRRARQWIRHHESQDNRRSKQLAV